MPAAFLNSATRMILVLYFYCIVLYLGLLRYRVDFQFSDLNEGIDEVDLNEY